VAAAGQPIRAELNSHFQCTSGSFTAVRNWLTLFLDRQDKSESVVEALPQ
jgi:hypothetical protein